MKFKFSMKLLLLLSAFSFLIISAFCIAGTYARYVTSLNSKSQIDISSWMLKVNEQDVINNSDFSSNLALTFNTGDDYSEYIVENKIAPTATGYAEVLIDYSTITLPFTYSITFASDNLEDLTFTGYSLDGGAIIPHNTTTITKNVTPDGVTTAQSFKLHFAWNDGTGQSLDDTEDTAYARAATSTELSLDVTFTQLDS